MSPVPKSIASPSSSLYVYLDGSPIGYVQEANVAEGYVVVYEKNEAGEYVKVRKEGTVRIELDGQPLASLHKEE